MSLEKTKSPIDLQTIADSYGYKPYPDDYEFSERIYLDINWTEKWPEIKSMIRESAKIFNDFMVTPESNEYFSHAKMGEVQLSSELTLVFEKTIPNNTENRKGPAFYILLKNKSDQRVADFNLEKKHGVWSMDHRKVEPQYREQGIAAHIVEMIESFVESYATESTFSQKLCMDSGQLDVLSYFAKRGYTIIPEQRLRFEQTLNKLEVGDPDFFFGKPTDKQKDHQDGQANINWYIFETEVWKQEPWTWEDYQKGSVRFTLKKEIIYNPTEAESRERQERVARTIRTTP